MHTNRLIYEKAIVKCCSYIAILVFSLVALSLSAQAGRDSICVNTGESHFGVPHVSGQSYSWHVNGGQIVSDPDSNVIRVAWNNVPGTYEVSVVASNGYGCPGDTSRYFINIKGPATANAKGPTQVCSGTYVTFESAMAGNFKWEGGQTTQSISFKAERDTMVSLIAINAPCPNDTFNYFLEVYDNPTAGMNYVQDTVLINTEETFYYTGRDGSPEIEWLYNGVFVSNRNAVQIEFDRPGEHEVIQIVKKGSCTDTISQWVYVDDIFKIFIPNAFTPNNDGVNDLFMFNGVGIKKYTAQIYNRWGEKVFEWNESSPVEGWDGTNSGQDSKMDAYIYKIHVTDESGEEHFYQDDFSLLR